MALRSIYLSLACWLLFSLLVGELVLGALVFGDDRLSGLPVNLNPLKPGGDSLCKLGGNELVIVNRPLIGVRSRHVTDNKMVFWYYSLPCDLARYESK